MYIYAVIIIHNGRFRFLPSISSLRELSSNPFFSDELENTPASPSRPIEREPRTVIHVKRAKRFDPMG